MWRILFFSLTLAITSRAFIPSETATQKPSNPLRAAECLQLVNNPPEHAAGKLLYEHAFVSVMDGLQARAEQASACSALLLGQDWAYEPSFYLRTTPIAHLFSQHI